MEPKPPSTTALKKRFAQALLALDPKLSVPVRWGSTDSEARWEIHEGDPFTRCTASPGTLEQIRQRLANLDAITKPEVRQHFERKATTVVSAGGVSSLNDLALLLMINQNPNSGTKWVVDLDARTWGVELSWLDSALVQRFMEIHPQFQQRRSELLQLRVAGGLLEPGPSNLPLPPTAQASAAMPSGLRTVERLLRHLMPQVILHGPPGTGKTRLARQVALRLLGDTTTDLGDDEAVTRALATYTQGAEASHAFVVFHPAYDYDQFIGGLRVEAKDGAVVYQTADGPLVRLATQARRLRDDVPALATAPACVLIIDEINRGNVPRLMGELLYAMEYRDSAVKLPYREQDFSLPKNLYIIGTMNTADRSVDSLDVALRRRFAFFPVEPDSNVVHKHWMAKTEPVLADAAAAAMNAVNDTLKGEQFNGLAVGPSYFLGESPTVLRLKLEHQLGPLLDEYARLSGVNLDGVRGKLDPLCAEIELRLKVNKKS